MLRHIRKHHDERGFTIIELLVVIVVIAILLAIAVPSYLRYQGRAQDTTAKADAAQLQKHVEVCRTLQGSYDPACQDVGQLVAANEGRPLGVSYGKQPGQVEVDPCTEGEYAAIPTCAPGVDGYAVAAHSRSGNYFFVYYWPGLANSPRRTCVTAGRAGCPADGTW